MLKLLVPPAELTHLGIISGLASNKLGDAVLTIGDTQSAGQAPLVDPKCLSDLRTGLLIVTSDGDGTDRGGNAHAIDRRRASPPHRLPAGVRR